MVTGAVLGVQTFGLNVWHRQLLDSYGTSARPDYPGMLCSKYRAEDYLSTLLISKFFEACLLVVVAHFFEARVDPAERFL